MHNLFNNSLDDPICNLLIARNNAMTVIQYIKEYSEVPASDTIYLLDEAIENLNFIQRWFMRHSWLIDEMLGDETNEI